ncbi:helix-turn-helix domain-containing protein [Streptomyces sp. NPDC091387]|uniref:helix-turn-helix domain-containing protein n=1 Tax=Streptomyces sp. NPDC091387 TaxID=3365998 RepID=UPI00381A1F7B
MPTLDDNHAGARIKEQRMLARLSRRELAARLPYSHSPLNQVECGARPATDAFVCAVAAALGIDAAVLQGLPQVPEVRRGRLAALLGPVREALDLYDLVQEPVTDRPVTALAAEADPRFTGSPSAT